MSRRNTAIAVALASALSATAAQAELSGNIAASSDYVWRGVTQTDHASAVSGGIDYAHETGFYVGGWASNIAKDTEIDLYAGYGHDFNGIGVDLGYISYVYPADTLADFSEVYLGLSYGIASVKFSYNTDSNNQDLYSELSLSQNIGGYDLGLHVGSYSYDNPSNSQLNGGDYVDYNVSLGKTVGEWSWQATINGVSADKGQDPNAFPYFSISRSFDL